MAIHAKGSYFLGPDGPVGEGIFCSKCERVISFDGDKKHAVQKFENRAPMIVTALCRKSRRGAERVNVATAVLPSTP